MWRHACLFCFWAFFFFFNSIRVPSTYFSLRFLIDGCKIRDLNISFQFAVNWLCAQLQTTILCCTCRPWLSRSTSIPLFPFCLEKVLSTPIQNTAGARFPSADATQQLAITGSFLYLLAWGPYKLLLFGLHPMHAACLQHFEKLPVELHRVGGWRDFLRQTHLASCRKGALRCYWFTPTTSCCVPWRVPGLKIILLLGWFLEFECF